MRAARERWARVEDIFQRALDIEEPARRLALLDAACAADPDLRREVSSLIAAHESAASVLALTAGVPAPDGVRSSSPCAAPTTRAFEIGDRVAGRYEVLGFIARGGMGEVYLVEDHELRVRVALKTIRAETARNEKALERLKSEVLLARRITHPNVCRIFDLGRHTLRDRSTTFLTMELLSGVSLAMRIREQGRLPEPVALPLLRQMATGLAAAHASGVVHCDFKSANVLLVAAPEGERAVLTDFGLALRAASETVEEAARAGGGLGLYGTPAYMAPEQVLGEPFGPAADIYALGIVIYEMVTGRLPFAAETPAATAMMRLSEGPPSPRSWVPGLDDRWERTILRCLARRPEDRFHSAGAVIAALEGDPAPLAQRESHSGSPAERDAFIGREPELAELARRLDAGARLITVVGTAGIGKTRLARRYGWTRSSSWPGGVWFADLSEVRDLAGIVASLGATLNVPIGDGDPVLRLGHAIAGRGRALVILDNFEQLVVHAQESVGQWLDRGQEASFIVTSRERLGLAGETVMPLEPLSPTAGVELFQARAREQKPDFALDDDAARDAVELVRLLDGLPLAIELAASRVRVGSVAQILARMDNRFRLLATSRQPGTRHGTLRAAIDWSWDLLEPWEKAALAQASVFEGGFTLPAADAVLDLSPWPAAPWMMDVVESLLDKSLLRSWTPAARSSLGASEPYFGLYSSIKEYAAEKLCATTLPGIESTPAEPAALARHGRYYAGFGTEEALEALSRHGVARQQSLVLSLDNLIAACQRAIAGGDADVAAATAVAAQSAWAIGGRVSRCDLLLAARLVPGIDSRTQARLTRVAGHELWRSGRVEEGGALIEQALAIHREGGDRFGEGLALALLGNLRSDQGRLEEGYALLEQAIATHRAIGNLRREGDVLADLAGVLQRDSRLVEARLVYERALAIHRDVGNRVSEGRVVGNLAIVHLKLGLMNEAGALFEQALAIHRECGNRQGEATTLANLSDLRLREGHTHEARSLCTQALAIQRESGNRRSEGVALLTLGEIEGRERRFPQARAALVRAEALLREVNDPLVLISLLCQRAACERDAADLAAARAALGEAQALCPASKSARAYLAREIAALRLAIPPAPESSE